MARGRLRGALVRLAEAHEKFATGRCSRAAILLAENAVFYARADLIEAEVRGLSQTPTNRAQSASVA